MSIILLCPVAIAAANSELPAASSDTSENTPQVKSDTPATELHNLKNEDLLTQAEETLTQASEHLRGQMRALSVADHQYQQAKQARLVLKLPTTQAKTKTADLLQQAKLKADAAQAKETFVQDQQKQIELEQTLLETWVKHNKTAQQAAEGLLDTIKNLRNGALLEMELRVQDGTLPAMPKYLTEKALDKIVRSIAPQQADLQKMLTHRQQDLQAIRTLHQEAKQTIEQAERQVKITQQDYQQALKRRELEKLYADQSAQQRASTFAALQEERVWLQGSLKLSQAKFTALVERAALAPESSQPKSQAEPIAETAPEDKTAAYNEHIRELERQQAALDELARFAPVIRADLDIVRTHLFKMQILVQQDDAQAQQLDELTQALQQIQDDAQQVDKVLVDNPQQIDQLAAQIKQEREQRDRMQAALQEAARKQSAAQQDKQREAQLKTLDDQQLVQYFSDVKKAVQTQEQDNQAQIDSVEQAQQQVDTARIRVRAVKNPLIRAAEQQATHEKVDILKTLRELAGLQALSAQASAQKSANTSQIDKTQTIAESDNTEKTLTGLNRYENLLSAELRMIEEYQHKRALLLEALKALQQVLKDQATRFANIRQKRFDLYASAVELRKRLGQGSLAQDGVPGGIIDALQLEPLTQLESTMTSLANRQARVDQSLQRLAVPTDTDTALKEKIQAIRALVGKRIDIFNDLYRLQDDMALQLDDLSESAQKALQQAAIRRMESEDDLSDSLLGFVPSARAQGIQDLLQSHYAELIHLEGHQESLSTQKEQTNRLIEYARSEQQALRKLVPLLQVGLEALKHERDAYDASVRIQLAPDQVLKIMQDYQRQTGQTLSMPTALPEVQREQAITGFANILFDYHIRIIATQQWIAQLEERLTEVGINREIAHYRNTLNQVDDQSARIDRRIHHLAGYGQGQADTTSESTQNPTSSPNSSTSVNVTMDQFLVGGQIGESRDALYRLRLQGALSVVYRVVAILVVAVLLIWLINHFMGRIINRLSTRKDQVSGDIQHTILAWTAIRAVSRILIWIIALIMILSSLGFQVGAILAGLGIGGLAVAMAAKESLSNILAGVMIFLDKPFTVGDVIQVGSYSTAKVEGIGWRTTCVVSPFGYYTHIPNSQVAETPLTNYTRQLPAGDYISVFVSHEYDPDQVRELINQALEQCTAIEQDQAKGTMMAGVKVIHQDAWMEYWPWWYTSNYHQRSGQREQVWYHIWKVLTAAGITFRRADPGLVSLNGQDKGDKVRGLPPQETPE